MDAKEAKVLGEAIASALLAKANDGAGQEPVRKGIPYVNRTAARILKDVGKAKDIIMKNGKTLDEAYEDYYGESLTGSVAFYKAASDYTDGNSEFADSMNWQRTGFMDEDRAKDFWDFVYDYASPFMKEITLITSAKNPYPIDLWAMIEENLISSTRSGSQPGSYLKDQLTIHNKTMLARHIEMQFDLTYEEIVNNLDRPGFENNIISRIMVGYANDILRLATNGTSYDYSGVTLSSGYNRSDMYKLAVGWVYNLQTMNGSYTDANMNSVVLGAAGKHMTPAKYTIPSVGTVTKWSPTFSSTTGWVEMGDAALTVADSKLKVADGAGSGTCYGRFDQVPVTRNSLATLYVTFKADDASQVSQVLVYDNAGTLLYSGAAITGVAETMQELKFNPGDNDYVQVRFSSVGNGHYTNFYTVSLTQEVSEHSGDDIIEYMNELYKLVPIEHKDMIKSRGAYIMGYDDIDKYADAKGSPVKWISAVGQYVGVNSNAREMYTVEGTVPRHKGIRVLPHPFMHSISDYVSYGGTSFYGSIILGDPKQLLIFGLTGNFPMKPLSTREFVARATGGGPKIEFTNHAWMDAETGPGGMFAIAATGLTVETPVLMKTGDPKSTAYADTKAFTDTTSVYPYCDTRDALIYVAASKTSLATAQALLADLDTAKANASSTIADGGTKLCTPGEAVSIAELSATKSYYVFRAFKDGILTKSSMISVNVD